MIEHIAWAMYVDTTHGDVLAPAWDTLRDKQKELWISQAKAALNALSSFLLCETAK